MNQIDRRVAPLMVGVETMKMREAIDAYEAKTRPSRKKKSK
jgi:hypothetical protein